MSAHKKIPATLQRIAEINTEWFFNDDPYSDAAHLMDEIEAGTLYYLVVKHRNKIVGYILYRIYKHHIESVRRAVTKKYRGQGYGLRLTKKLIDVSNRLDKDIYTYVSKTNLPSLNSNLKLGYRIENISDDWVHIRYKSA